MEFLLFYFLEIIIKKNKDYNYIKKTFGAIKFLLIPKNQTKLSHNLR
jgi:hypothetical protein